MDEAVEAGLLGAGVMRSGRCPTPCGRPRPVLEAEISGRRVVTIPALVGTARDPWGNGAGVRRTKARITERILGLRPGGGAGTLTKAELVEHVAAAGGS